MFDNAFKTRLSKWHKPDIFNELPLFLKVNCFIVSFRFHDDTKNKNVILILIVQPYNYALSFITNEIESIQMIHIRLSCDWVNPYSINQFKLNGRCHHQTYNLWTEFKLTKSRKYFYTLFNNKKNVHRIEYVLYNYDDFLWCHSFWVGKQTKQKIWFDWTIFDHNVTRAIKHPPNSNLQYKRLFLIKSWI